MNTLGKKYVLGTYAKGSRVRLSEYNWKPTGGWYAPGEWVTVVLNCATTTGVMVIKSDKTGAIYERDGRSPLFEVDVFNIKKEIQ